jgi:hypothetical protein
LSNSSLANLVPFLSDVDEFRRHGFNALKVLGQITFELKSMIPIDNIDDLVYYITDRYFLALNRHFESWLTIAIRMGRIHEYRYLYEKLTKYRLDILNYLKSFTAKKLDQLNRQYYGYYSEYNYICSQVKNILAPLDDYPKH